MHYNAHTNNKKTLMSTCKKNQLSLKKHQKTANGFFVNLKLGGICTSSNSSAYRFSENLDAPGEWINSEMK